MRKLLSILSMAVLMALTSRSGALRLNKVITITSGTPIQVSTTSALANRVLIEALHAGTGIVYVCWTLSGTTPSASCAGTGQLAAELAPASSTAPGGSYSDSTSPDAGGPLDLINYWLDGGNSGDKVLVSWDARQ